jgi:hypothetical protein
MNWCKIFGHKWEIYKQQVPNETPSWIGRKIGKTFTIMVDTEFRFCGKCFTNQVRVAHTSKDEIDWKNCELNIDQLRDKKLKELGI